MEAWTEKQLKDKIKNKTLPIQNKDLFGNFVVEIEDDKVVQSIPEPKFGPREIQFEIKGFYYKKNENSNPIPKQSDRNMVDRIKNGPNKGDVFTYKNKRTGLLDVIQRHYQPSLITKTKENYLKQLLHLIPKDFVMFTEYVHVVKMQFVFTPLKSFSKKKMALIQQGVEQEKTTKPDIDNLEKFIYDVLEDAEVFTNDSLISRKNDISKIYGLVPKTIIHLKGE